MPEQQLADIGVTGNVSLDTTGPIGAAGELLNGPQGLFLDGAGDLYFADTGNHRIRQVTPDGLIHTIAGQDAAGFYGDGGLAVSARIDSPGGLLLDDCAVVVVRAR